MVGFVVIVGVCWVDIYVNLICGDVGVCVEFVVDRVSVVVGGVVVVYGVVCGDWIRCVGCFVGGGVYVVGV